MRSIPEWIGKSDDTRIPGRVRLRVFDRNGWACQECGRHMNDGEVPECDHVIALINGGENRESNLQTLCRWCHNKKTTSDVATKAKSARIRSKRAGKRRDEWLCSRCEHVNRKGRDRCYACGEYR